MMNDKAEIIRNIHRLDFAIHELVLFLDSHPKNDRALQLLESFKKRREDAIAAYEQKYGTYTETPDTADTNNRWHWIDSPWPWEINFLED